jgi:hypothetical protein
LEGIVAAAEAVEAAEAAEAAEAVHSEKKGFITAEKFVAFAQTPALRWITKISKHSGILLPNGVKSSPSAYPEHAQSINGN